MTGWQTTPPVTGRTLHRFLRAPQMPLAGGFSIAL